MEREGKIESTPQIRDLALMQENGLKVFKSGSLVAMAFVEKKQSDLLQVVKADFSSVSLKIMLGFWVWALIF